MVGRLHSTCVRVSLVSTPSGWAAPLHLCPCIYCVDTQRLGGPTPPVSVYLLCRHPAIGRLHTTCVRVSLVSTPSDWAAPLYLCPCISCVDNQWLDGSTPPVSVYLLCRHPVIGRLHSTCVRVFLVSTPSGWAAPLYLCPRISCVDTQRLGGSTPPVSVYLLCRHSVIGRLHTTCVRVFLVSTPSGWAAPLYLCPRISCVDTQRLGGSTPPVSVYLLCRHPAIGRLHTTCVRVSLVSTPSDWAAPLHLCSCISCVETQWLGGSTLLVSVYLLCRHPVVGRLHSTCVRVSIVSTPNDWAAPLHLCPCISCVDTQ